MFDFIHSVKLLMNLTGGNTMGIRDLGKLNSNNHFCLGSKQVILKKFESPQRIVTVLRLLQANNVIGKVLKHRNESVTLQTVRSLSLFNEMLHCDRELDLRR
jgi:hypothetical protein